MKISMMLEVPDEKTVADARALVTAISEEFDDIQIVYANLLNVNYEVILDLKED